MNISMHKYTLRLLLALVVTFASVASVAHIHIDEHHSEHQIEQCLNFHQLQLDQTSALLIFNPNHIDATKFQLSDFDIDTDEIQLTSQARAPPIAS